MCGNCFVKFDFRSHGRTVVEARREVAACADLLLDSSAADRRRRVADGDVRAAEAEAFLQKWLGTSRQFWDRVVEASTGYTSYIEAMGTAAELGSTDAMIDLARNGPAEGRRDWMVTAAEAGRPPAMMWLAAAAAESGDIDSAITWARSASDARCEKAMVMFGLLVRDAVRHERVDASAVDELRAAASAQLIQATEERSDGLAHVVLLDLLAEWGDDVPADLADPAGGARPTDDPWQGRRHPSWFNLLE